jgi:hypothetical protein
MTYGPAREAKPLSQARSAKSLWCPEFIESGKFLFAPRFASSNPPYKPHGTAWFRSMGWSPCAEFGMDAPFLPSVSAGLEGKGFAAWHRFARHHAGRIAMAAADQMH